MYTYYVHKDKGVFYKYIKKWSKAYPAARTDFIDLNMIKSTSTVERMDNIPNMTDNIHGEYYRRSHCTRIIRKKCPPYGFARSDIMGKSRVSYNSYVMSLSVLFH